MERRNFFKFLSFLPFACLGKEAWASKPRQTGNDPDIHVKYLEEEISRLQSNIMFCEAFGQHKEAEKYRKQLLLLEDALLVYRLRRTPDRVMYERKVGNVHFVFSMPEKASPQEVERMFETLKQRHLYPS